MNGWPAERLAGHPRRRWRRVCHTAPAGPILGTVRLPRGSLLLRRMRAHAAVLAAAALAVFVTAALAAALAIFTGQALPRAARQDLASQPDVWMDISGSVAPGQAGRYQAGVPAVIRAALQGVPVTIYQALWSDPLGVSGAAGARLGGPGEVPLVQAAALTGLRGHAVLVSGHWPAAPRPGQPIPAALPEAAAVRAHLAAGALLSVHDQVSGRPERFLITGVYRPRATTGPAAGYWRLDLIGASGAASSSGFTTYGPLTVSPAAFTAALAVGQGAWAAHPQTGRIPDGALTTVAARVAALGQSLPGSAALPGLQLATGLPAALDAAAASLAVGRSLLVICALELALIAAAALAAAAAYLAEQRAAEAALLSARGASGAQLIRLAVAEALLVCVTAAAAGTVAGGALAAVVAGPALAGRLPLLSPAAWWLLPLTAAAAAAILAWPAVRTARPGVAARRSGRQAARSAVARAGGDLALVGLAVLTGWQLRSAAARGTGGIDVVLALAPVLALAGGAAVTLRLLPVLARGADQLASRGTGLVPAMSCWHVSRRPLSQARGALLVVLAVAAGTLALSQHRSWVRSAADQAAFSAGADVRVDLPAPLAAGPAARLTAAPGVRDAMPVAVLPAGTGQTLALDAGLAARVALLRPDQSAVPATSLFRDIEPPGRPAGITLAGHPAAVRLEAAFGPASLGLGPAAVTLSFQDASGSVYQVLAGALPADGHQHVLTARLGPGRLPEGAIYPLRFVALTVGYTMPASASRLAAGFTVLRMAASEDGGVPGTALRSWTAAVSSAELDSLSRQPGSLVGRAARPGGVSGPGGRPPERLSFDPGHALAAGPSPGSPPERVYGQLTLTDSAPRPAVLPAIATGGYLRATSTQVGSVTSATISGATVPVKIVAAVASFPTVPPGSGALIVDLAAVQQVLNSNSLAPVPVTQWWLATAGTAASPGLAAGLPAGTALTSRARLETGLLGNPVAAAPQQAVLAVAAAAALLAIAGLLVSIAAGASERRTESALLAALGVGPRAQARQLFLQELMLSLPAAVAGLALGIIVTILLVPAVILTPAATPPVPPALTEFAWSQALSLAAFIALLPAVLAAAAAARRADPAASLRAAGSG